MSQRKNKLPAASTAAIASETPIIAGSLLVERILIGGLTALLVARPLVAGDDPGRLRLTSGAGPLALNFLTFLLLLGWSVWRAWTKRRLSGGPGWIVVLGLLCVSALAFVSANGSDRYQRPGWFIGWDWVSIAVLCFLAWQLATTPAITRGLIAVLLATAVAIASQALYQKAANNTGLPSTEPDPLPPPAIPLVGDDEFGLSLHPPIPPNGLFRGTFDRPDTLLVYMFLLLSPALLWGVAGWRGSWRNRGIVLIPVVLFVVLLVAFTAWFPMSGKNLRSALDAIGRSPFIGVGLGNFGRVAEYGAESAGSYWLGFAATAGIIAASVLLAVLLATLLIVDLRIPRISLTPDPVIAEESPRRGARWEFYLGGMAGLLIGMILATSDIPAEADASEMLRLGVLAALRAIVWFSVFALLETVIVDPRKLTGSLPSGACTVVSFSIMSSGLDSPSLAQPFWIVVTLALTSLSAHQVRRAASLPIAWVGVPIALAIFVANLVHVGLPGIVTAGKVRTARIASKEYPTVHGRTEGKTGADRATALRMERDFIRNEIILPLNDAIRGDSDNSALLLERARWGRRRYANFQQHQEAGNAEAEAKQIIAFCAKATKIDPHNLGGPLGSFETRLMIASASFPPRQEHMQQIDKAIGAIAARDREREVGLRYRVVQMLLTKKSPDALDDWALQLLRFGRERGRLTDDQRTELIERLRKANVQPSKELAEILGDAP